MTDAELLLEVTKMFARRPDLRDDFRNAFEREQGQRRLEYIAPSSTHTYALLELSAAAYEEIERKLREAGYDHAFDEDGVIDMHGIGVGREG